MVFGKLPDVFLALHGQVAAVGEGILGLTEFPRIQVHLLEGREFHETGREVRADDTRPRDPVQVLAPVEPGRDLGRLQFSRSINQDFRPRVQEDGAADLVVPIIVVGEAPERGLDTADRDLRTGKEPPDDVAGDDDCPVGHGGSVGRVLVLLALPLERGVVDEHAVDGPGRDAEEKARRPQLEVVRLRAIEPGDWTGA